MSATTDPHRTARSPADLEREAGEIRADMDRTLDALERKLSPSDLLERAASLLRDHGNDVARAVGGAVKSNPLPVALTVAGLGWLVFSMSTSHRPRKGTDFSRTGTSQAHRAAQEYIPAGRGRAQAVRDKARTRMAQAMDSTRMQARRARDGAQELIEEKPLVVGSIAFALGALIGAAIPATRYEDRAMGTTRDQALDKAKQAGERQYGKLRRKLQSREDIEVSGRAH